MTVLDALTPVGELVASGCGRARVFEQHGIDYCCAGKTPLAKACAECGVDLSTMLQELNGAEARFANEPQTDWTRASLADLIDHIVTTHHSYMRRALRRLETLAAKVGIEHWQQHPELLRLYDMIDRLCEELTVHMSKEEMILFPMIERLEAGEPVAGMFAGGLEGPIEVIEHEHARCAAMLSELRRITKNYAPPADACASYRALFTGLAALEADLHQHVHKENNILFPRASALVPKHESRVTGRRAS
jgi:regulator of cell morphogenesis and NO signaling